jgi:hypothetical protein
MNNQELMDMENADIFKSKYLFWDIDISKLEIERDKEIIIERALTIGLDKDEYLLFKLYAMEDIKRVVKNIKCMDKKTCNYLSFRLNIPKEDFRCYKQKQWI